ncbi:MAG: multicopper oxidase family protein [Frankia sp.]
MSTVDRRLFLRAGLAASGLGALSACGSGGETSPPSRSAGLVRPTDPVVAAVDKARATTGQTRRFALDAMVGEVDLGGPVVSTWTYGGVLPGGAIRVRKGDVVEAVVTNGLPEATTMHWHGVALRNDMDGAPVTQTPIQPGKQFTYRFVAAEPGTYWFHPHIGVQQDRGLYASLIVEDPTEKASYDEEWTVVLDDWIDGTGHTPDQVLATLRHGMGMSSASTATAVPGMSMSGGSMGATVAAAGASATEGTGDGVSLMSETSALLGGDAGDVRYPYYLINGRVPAAPAVFTGKPGQRVRIRILNAGGDTAFRVALGSHTMTVTHTDGYPVTPTDTQSLLIGMGERYDVQVTLGDGAFPLVALAEGKNAAALALVRTGAGSAPAGTVRPAELNQMPLAYDRLHPTAAVTLADRSPDVTGRVQLTGGMTRYNWGLDGSTTYDPNNPLVLVRQGQRVRVTWTNTTTMWHPMHIHGHTFQINGTGPRKDTVIVKPGQTVTCDFDADNPGQWMTHCHNVYHAESGMMGVIGYRT